MNAKLVLSLNIRFYSQINTIKAFIYYNKILIYNTVRRLLHIYLVLSSNVDFEFLKQRL